MANKGAEIHALKIKERMRINAVISSSSRSRERATKTKDKSNPNIAISSVKLFSTRRNHSPFSTKAKNVTFNNFKLDGGIGDVKLIGELTGDVNIDRGIGDIKMELLGDYSNHEIDVDGNLGDEKIKGINFNTSGDYEFNVDNGIGDIKLYGAGLGEFDINVGDVNLDNQKVLVDLGIIRVETNSDDVKVDVGGIKVETNNDDVKVDVGDIKVDTGIEKIEIG